MVLPALAVTEEPIKFEIGKRFEDDIWCRVREIVVANKIGLLLTTINLDLGEGRKEEALIYFLSNGTYDVLKNIHSSPGRVELLEESKILDLSAARVGILSTVDALFPEMHTSLAKRGVDIVLISSDYRKANRLILDSGYVLPQLSKNSFFDLLKVATHHSFHLAVADSSGHSMLIKDGEYPSNTYLFSDEEFFKIIEVDSESERIKNLNEYYPFDLDDLLSFVTYMDLERTMQIQNLYTIGRDDNFILRSAA